MSKFLPPDLYRSGKSYSRWCSASHG